MVRCCMCGRSFYGEERGDVGNIKVFACVSTAYRVVKHLLRFFCVILYLLFLGEARQTLGFCLPDYRFYLVEGLCNILFDQGDCHVVPSFPLCPLIILLSLHWHRWGRGVLAGFCLPSEVVQYFQ